MAKGFRYFERRAQDEQERVELAQANYRAELSRLERGAHEFNDNTIEGVRERVAAKFGIPKCLLNNQ